MKKTLYYTIIEIVFFYLFTSMLAVVVNVEESNAKTIAQVIAVVCGIMFFVMESFEKKILKYFN